MYLGGNGFYWRIEYHVELPGVIELRRANGMRAWHAQPGEGCHAFLPGPGGTWRELGRPPQRLVGVGSTAVGHEYSIGYRRLPDSHGPRAPFSSSKGSARAKSSATSDPEAVVQRG